MKNSKNKVDLCHKSDELLRLPETADSNKSLAIIGQNDAVQYRPANIKLHLRLNTIGNTRRSMAAVIRAANRGDLSHEEARSFSYLIQTLCGAYRAEQELMLTKQIAELRKMVEELEQEGKI